MGFTEQCCALASSSESIGGLDKTKTWRTTDNQLQVGLVKTKFRRVSRVCEDYFKALEPAELIDSCIRGFGSDLESDEWLDREGEGTVVRTVDVNISALVHREFGRD